MMKSITYLRFFIIFSIFLCFTFSCSNDDDGSVPVDPLSLLAKITSENVSSVRIPAYGYSDVLPSTVLVLYYVESGATDVEYYKTENTTVDRNDYNNYREYQAESRTLFVTCEQNQVDMEEGEYFVIVKYTVGNQIRLSSPIKINHIEKPTVWNSSGITIDESTPEFPFFFWDRDVEGESAKFLIAILNEDETKCALVTDATSFQYYDISFVVENFTLTPPLGLNPNSPGTVNLLDINEDNWANRAIVKFF